jgi:hypothetical protein
VTRPLQSGARKKGYNLYMEGIVAPGLRALLEKLIDYAGMFPPATLPRDAAVANYQRYRNGAHAWMLRWLVVGAAELEHVPRELDGSLSVLSDTDEPRAAAIESRRIIVQAGRSVYCEVPVQELDEVRRAGAFAKLRTGGVKPEAIPGVEEVAAFIRACAVRRLPFKATAGLHHPVRAPHPLTYEADAPRAVMHGFLNVFLAAAFAWHGRREIEPVLAETDTAAFRFDDRAHWRDWSLDAAQVREARTQFAHAFGSCSFEEPVQELEALGLL